MTTILEADPTLIDHATVPVKRLYYSGFKCVRS